MPRKLRYKEFRIVRLPEGTLARIDALGSNEAQAERLRRYVLDGLRRDEDGERSDASGDVARGRG